MRSAWVSRSVFLSEMDELLLESGLVQRVHLLVYGDCRLSDGEYVGGSVKLHFGSTSGTHEMVLLMRRWESCELLLSFLVVGQPLGDPGVLLVRLVPVSEVKRKHGKDLFVAGHAGVLVVVDAQAKCERHLRLTGREGARSIGGTWQCGSLG